ncbi:hypothetical protein PV325_013096 [Microctonus aethiopoides]|nr:hypothetical protein PV325_013096 [Microctonus aethiopoides]KAK0096501.1 hypothetical protein PV326_005302 [Microctonus aethiopoides]KAK0163706.1 hypothetical protein PV328_002410 [Microctonus aethiopoides]
MGVIISRLTKPLKSFNIESRAQKVLNRQKPVPAPSYLTTAEQLRISKEANPKFMEDHYKKDQQLYNRLKNVFVLSHVQQAGVNNKKSKKPLPQRTTEVDFDYGFWEPTEVPVGRCHLKTAIEFMTDHSTNPDLHTAEIIASKRKLISKDVENILEYYRVYQVIKNDDGKIVTVPRNEIKGEIDCK